MYVKELMPVSILERLQEKKEQPVLDYFINKIESKKSNL
jgi:hypothetical protein